MNVRERAWFSLSEAPAVLRDEGLQRALKVFTAQRSWAKVQQDRGSLRLRCNAIFRQQTGAANTAGAPHADGVTALYANALKG